jgi:hypothetical protein
MNLTETLCQRWLQAFFTFYQQKAGDRFWQSDTVKFMVIIMALSKQNICEIPYKTTEWQLSKDQKSLELHYECLK